MTTTATMNLIILVFAAYMLLCAIQRWEDRKANKH
jgi:hypothetical protein